MSIMRKPSLSSEPKHQWQISHHKKQLKSLSLVALMLFSVFASIQFVSLEARATTDQDGDGLSNINDPWTTPNPNFETEQIIH